MAGETPQPAPKVQTAVPEKVAQKLEGQPAKPPEKITPEQSKALDQDPSGETAIAKLDDNARKEAQNVLAGVEHIVA